LQTPDESWLVQYDAFQKYKAFTKKMINIRDFLLETEAYVAVFDFRGRLTTTWTIRDSDRIYRQSQEQQWFKETKELKGAPLWRILPNEMEFGDAEADERFLGMTRLLTGSTGKGYGVVLIAMPIRSMLPEMIDRLEPQEPGEEKNGLFLSDRRSLLLGQPDLYRALSLNERMDVGPKDDYTLRNGYLINEREIKQLGWRMTEAVRVDSFSAKLQSLRNQSIFGLGMLLLICCVLYILIMLRVIKPLKLMYRSMSKVGNGNFTPIAPVKGNDELALLSRKFNDMVGNLDVLVKNVAEEQRRKEEARFQALQAQVKPHFLFNTLNSIKWSARLSGAEHVSEMITSLGKLLSYSMKNNEELTALRHEIEFVESYVSLQNIRFNNKVRMEVRLDENLMDVPILKFTLQPIIENSIIHGKTSPLRIEIDGQLRDQTVSIVVRDNGGGDGSQTDAVNEDLSKFSGIGLNNIHDRLKAHLGDGFGLSVRNIKNEGYEVSLRIPLRKGDRNIDQSVDHRR
jgi:signal transduction histidine kinase